MDATEKTVSNQYVAKWDANTHTASDRFVYTTFRDRFGSQCQQVETTWTDFIDNIKIPKEHSTKPDLPLLKLATFGDTRTENNSLRHNANIITITGVEGDYDGGLVQPEEALRKLEAHGIRGVIYTSPSHQPNAPRFRVLAPLSAPLAPNLREAMIARVNGALGGILASESFVLSQAFYYGRVSGVEYKCLTTFGDPRGGTCIDLLTELDGIAVGRAVETRNDARVGQALYRDAHELVARLGRRLKTGDGRRELLKSYIGARSARGLQRFEIEALVGAFAREYFDPEDPVDTRDVNGIISWVTSRDAPNRAQLTVFEEARRLHGTPSLSTQPSHVPGRRLDSTTALIQVPSTPPPPRQYIFANTVTPGTVCAIAGTGGSSKTMLAMQICVAAASGTKVGELEVAVGASLLILGEEDVAERDRRIGGICAHFKVEKALVERRMRCFPAAGIDIRLTETDQGNPRETELADEIVQLASDLAEESETRVTIIVVDHARLVIGGDPNDAKDVTQLTRVLTSIAQRTGAAVLLLAHSPKNVIGKTETEITAADIAGSGAFVDNARSAFMVHTMRAEDAKNYEIPSDDHQRYVQLINVKANYAATGSRHWFKRETLNDWGIAVLEPAVLFPKASGKGKAKQSLENCILDTVKAKPGGWTMRALRDRAGLEGPLKASEKAVRAAISDMLETGVLVSRAPTDEERRVHRLGGQVKEVLVAKT